MWFKTNIENIEAKIDIGPLASSGWPRRKGSHRMANWQMGSKSAPSFND